MKNLLKTKIQNFLVKYGTENQKIHIINYDGYLNPKSNALYKAYKNKNLKKIESLLSYCSAGIINYPFKFYNDYGHGEYHTIFEEAFYKVFWRDHYVIEHRYKHAHSKSSKRKIRKFMHNLEYNEKVLKILLPYCDKHTLDKLLLDAFKYKLSLVELIIDKCSKKFINSPDPWDENQDLTLLAMACQDRFPHSEHTSICLVKTFLPYCYKKTIERKYKHYLYKDEPELTLLDRAYQYNHPRIVQLLIPYLTPYLNDTLLDWAFKETLQEKNFRKCKTHIYI